MNQVGPSVNQINRDGPTNLKPKSFSNKTSLSPLPVLKQGGKLFTSDSAQIDMKPKGRKLSRTVDKTPETNADKKMVCLNQDLNLNGMNIQENPLSLSNFSSNSFDHQFSLKSFLDLKYDRKNEKRDRLTSNFVNSNLSISKKKVKPTEDRTLLTKSKKRTSNHLTLPKIHIFNKSSETTPFKKNVKF